jgi:hypothetical protein
MSLTRRSFHIGSTDKSETELVKIGIYQEGCALPNLPPSANKPIGPMRSLQSVSHLLSANRESAEVCAHPEDKKAQSTMEIKVSAAISTAAGDNDSQARRPVWSAYPFLPRALRTQTAPRSVKNLMRRSDVIHASESYQTLLYHPVIKEVALATQEVLLLQDPQVTLLHIRSSLLNGP